MWPEESWRRAKGNKRKQTTNIASNEVENTNKLKGWTSEWTGSSQLRTKALQGDQNQKNLEFKASIPYGADAAQWRLA